MLSVSAQIIGDTVEYSPVTRSSRTTLSVLLLEFGLLLSAVVQIIGATFRVCPPGLSVGAQMIGDNLWSMAVLLSVSAQTIGDTVEYMQPCY